MSVLTVRYLLCDLCGAESAPRTDSVREFPPDGWAHHYNGIAENPNVVDTCPKCSPAILAARRGSGVVHLQEIRDLAPGDAFRDFVAAMRGAFPWFKLPDGLTVREVREALLKLDPRRANAMAQRGGLVGGRTLVYREIGESPHSGCGVQGNRARWMVFEGISRITRTIKQQRIRPTD